MNSSKIKDSVITELKGDIQFLRNKLKEAKSEIKNRINSEALEFLSFTLKQMLGPMSMSEFFKFVSDQLYSISGGAIICFSEFDNVSNKVVVKELRCSQGERNKLLKILGTMPEGLEFNFPEEIRKRIIPGGLDYLEGGFSMLVFNQLPEAICKEIEKELNIKSIYAMACSVENEILGTVAIISHEKNIREKKLIESIVNQAALVLKRKRVESILCENEQRLQGMFDNAAIGIAEVDSESRFININNRICKILGYSHEELKGKSIYDITAAEDLVHSHEINLQMLEGKLKVCDYEKRYIRKDGSKIWVHVSLSAINADHYLKTIRTIEDITARKQAEEALKKSEERFRLLADNISQIAWIANNKGEILWYNKRWYDFTGLSIEQSHNSIEQRKLTHPDHFERVLNSYYESINSGKDWEDIYPLMCRNGEYRWFLARALPIKDDKGEITLWFGTHTDISDQRKAQEELRENEEKFRSLFENITEGVALHEIIYENKKAVNYRIIDVNPAYKTHTGIDPKDVIGKLATDAYGTTDVPYLREYSKVAEQRKPYRFETFFPGLKKYFMINVISPRKSQFATVFEDITEQKAIEQEMQLKNEELTRFIYTVSHDLKSPLVTIKMFTSYLKEDIEKHNLASQETDIRYIENAADKMGRLLDELLELSRIGRKENTQTEVTLQNIAEEAISLVAGRIKERGAKVVISSPPVLLYGHAQRFIQLYQNLIDNAVKFMGIQPEPIIEIGSYINDDNEIVLFVKDNGTGIDSKYKNKVFGLFEKLDPDTEGTGIGLALAKRIVEVHGGSICYSSEGMNKGTTFYFTLAKTKLLKH